MEYFNQEAAKLKRAFLAKNVDVLLIRERYVEGKRKMKEVENARVELVAKLVAAKAEAKRLVAEVGSLQGKKAEAKTKLTGVELEMDLIHMELRVAKASRLVLENQL